MMFLSQEREAPREGCFVDEGAELVETERDAKG
jgi:hypothetical protein